MAQICFVLAINAFWPPADCVPLPVNAVGEGIGGEKLDSGDEADTEPSPSPGEP